MTSAALLQDLLNVNQGLSVTVLNVSIFVGLTRIKEDRQKRQQTILNSPTYYIALKVKHH